MSTTEVTTPLDRFDRLCSCALIDIWPSEERRFASMSTVYQQEWKRKVVNAHRHRVIPDADCLKCGGSGEIPPA
jgi:hypothetical protein